jgi:hypothetical protein
MSGLSYPGTPNRIILPPRRLSGLASRSVASLASPTEISTAFFPHKTPRTAIPERQNEPTPAKPAARKHRNRVRAAVAKSSRAERMLTAQTRPPIHPCANGPVSNPKTAFSCRERCQTKPFLQNKPTCDLDPSDSTTHCGGDPYAHSHTLKKLGLFGRNRVFAHPPPLVAANLIRGLRSQRLSIKCRLVVRSALCTQPLSHLAT